MTEFNRVDIRPFEILSEAWTLIRPRYWLFFGITAVGILIGGLFAIVLMGPMMCGIFYSILRQMRGEPVRFEDLFKGFDYFVQSLIATLLLTVPIILLMVPLYLIAFFTVFASMSKAGDGPPQFPIFAFVSTILLFIVVIGLCALVIGVVFIFVYPLIVDRKMSAIDAIKTSAAASWANLGGIFKLVLLNFLLGIVGALFLYVGAFFILPITLTAQLIAYRRVFPASL